MYRVTTSRVKDCLSDGSDIVESYSFGLVTEKRYRKSVERYSKRFD